MIIIAVIVQQKKNCTNFSKAKTKFFLSLDYNADNIYQFVSTNEICKFQADNKNVNFLMQFCPGSISNKLDYYK